MFGKFNFVCKDTISPKNVQSTNNNGSRFHNKNEVHLVLLIWRVFRTLPVVVFADLGWIPRSVNSGFNSTSQRVCLPGVELVREPPPPPLNKWMAQVKADGMGGFFESCCVGSPVLLLFTELYLPYTEHPV